MFIFMVMNYRQIDLNDWELQGEGAFGESYFSKTDSSIMLKLIKSGRNKDDFITEYENSRKIASVGFKTPAAIEMVEEPQSGRLGIIYEKVREKVSFTRMIHDNPSDLPRIAQIHAEEAKKFHGINCDPSQFLCYKDSIREAIPRLFTFRKYKVILKAALELVPDSHGCLQHDFQPGNIVHSNKTGENYWIDMGDFGYGHYLFDIAILYMFTQILCKKKGLQQIFHMTEQQLRDYWVEFTAAYFGRAIQPDEMFGKKIRLYLALALTIKYHMIPAPGPIKYIILNVMLKNTLKGISLDNVADIMAAVV